MPHSMRQISLKAVEGNVNNKLTPLSPQRHAIQLFTQWVKPIINFSAKRAFKAKTTVDQCKVYTSFG